MTRTIPGSPGPPVDPQQAQARALGDPTRHRLFRHLVDADGPLGVAELTALLGVHHNAVRQHLAKLVDAGLVRETRERRATPGRPRLLYAPDAGAVETWATTGAYERLAVLLAEALATGDTPEEVGRRAGRAYPPLVGGDGDDDGGDVVDALRREMARQGFDPVVEPGEGHVEVVLRRCPFASAVLANPSAVCAVHLGLAEGVADAVGGLQVDELVAHDPRRAGCRLVVREQAEP